MVVSLLPLPLLTFVVFQMMNRAYRKQVTNVPLETLGKVQKWFTEVIDRNPEDAEVPTAREMTDLSGKGRNGKLKDRLSLFRGSSSSRAPEAGLSRSVTHGNSVPDLESITIRHRRSVRSMLDPVIDSEPSPFHDPEDIDPLIDPVLQHDAYDLVDDSEEALVDLMKQHLEPPITRTSGILDIPLGASILQFGENDIIGEEFDAQQHSYLHPCLIGKLPTPWFDGENFAEMRREKTREQQILLNKLISQQKLAIATEERADEQGNDSITESILKFIDGFTSWTHLTIS
jgi:hypothetical protein